MTISFKCRRKNTSPYSLYANVVYKFICRSCNAAYIGQTGRHLCICIQEG